MTLYVLFLGAVLTLLTAALPALMSPIWNPGTRLRDWIAFHIAQFRWAWGDLLLDECGVVTITYTSAFINNGTSTAPTAAQAAELVVQTAEVAFADTDAQAVIVHNWGSVINYPAPASWSSFLLPYIQYYCLQTTTSPSSFATNFTFGITNTNSITMNKINVGTGSGGTFAVIMRRV